MDYLSAELPCVLGRGDEIAEEFGAAGFATLLDEPDAARLASTLIALADDPGALAAARAAGAELAAEHHWSTVGVKLRAAVAGVAAERPSSQPELPTLLGATGGYYVRRLVDRLVTAT
jgi:hypothetical protein